MIPAVRPTRTSPVADDATDRPVCRFCGHVDTPDDPVNRGTHTHHGGWLAAQCCHAWKCRARCEAQETEGPDVLELTLDELAAAGVTGVQVWTDRYGPNWALIGTPAALEALACTILELVQSPREAA